MDCDNNAPTDSCLDPENREMFAISYVIIFAFRPELNFDRIIIERSFGYSLTKTHKFILFDQRPINIRRFEENASIKRLCNKSQQTKV